MISLGWDTHGRLSRRAYRAAQTRIGLTAFIGMIVGAVVVMAFTKQNTYISLAVVGAVVAVVVYLQYRDAQLSIKRLHDRNLPGWLLWPIMALTLVTIGTASYVLMGALYKGGLTDFIFSLYGILQPLVGLAFQFSGIGFLLAIAFVVYGLFIQYNLNADSKPGPNRYGEDVGE